MDGEADPDFHQLADGGCLMTATVEQITPKGTAAAVGDFLLDRKKLGAILDMSPGAITTALYRGTFPIPPVRLGRHVRWRASDVRKYLESMPTDGEAE